MRRIRWLIAVMLGLSALPFVASRSEVQAQADQRCFPETGFCVAGRIREFWEQNGALPVFGYPKGPQHEALIEGRPFLVQWFERNRLELHPENARPYDVLLGRLGVDRLAQQGRDWLTFPKSASQPGCRFFPQTGHNVCGAILAAWRASGLEFDGRGGKSETENLALFGLPLSAAHPETVEGQEYTIQWFERARFELHPEKTPPYNVLLGLLGNEVQSNLTPAPQPTTAATTAPPTPEPTIAPPTPEPTIAPAPQPTTAATPAPPTPEPTVAPASVLPTTEALIWRPRVSPTDKPKPSAPAASCDDNPNDNIGCSQSPIESTTPIDIQPGASYYVNLPYRCSDGVIKADVAWQGANAPKLYVDGTSHSLGGANYAEIQADFSNGSTPSVALNNPSKRVIRVSSFGVTMGCNVRSIVDSVWVDHNVYEGGAKGMRIHVAFSVSNQKGVESAVVAYFSNQNGEKIKTSQRAQLAVRVRFTPRYDNTRYDDVVLFMPYGNIPGSQGTHYLRFRIRLYDVASSDFFGRSEYVNFTLTR